MLPLISRILTGQHCQYSWPWTSDLDDNMAAIGFYDDPLKCPPCPIVTPSSTMICPPTPDCTVCDQNWEEWMKTERAIISVAITIFWFSLQLLLRQVQRQLVAKGMRVAHPAERALSIISGIPVRADYPVRSPSPIVLPSLPPSYRTEEPKPREMPYDLDSVCI